MDIYYHPCSPSMGAIEELFLSISIAMMAKDEKRFNELREELKELHLPQEFIDDFAIEQIAWATRNGTMDLCSDEAYARNDFNSLAIQDMLFTLGASEQALDEGYTIGLQERNRNNI